jgi:hypothetical protein
MARNKTEFTFLQLALMNWLMEKPDRFISISTSYGTSKELYFYEAEKNNETGSIEGNRVYPLTNQNGIDARKLNTEFLKKIGGKANIDVVRLHHQGMVTSHSAFGSSEFSRAFFNRVSMGRYHHGQRFDLPTPKMARFWAKEGKAAYEEELASIQQKAADVRRQIVIGRNLEFKPKIPKELKDRWPTGLALPYPKVKKVRPLFSATVTKVTPTRVYIDDVKPLSTERDYYTIKGREPNLYVEWADVIADYADEPLIDKLLNLDNEFHEDVNRISIETITQMLPLITNIDSRFKQKEAEHDDMLKDIVVQGHKPKP